MKLDDDKNVVELLSKEFLKIEHPTKEQKEMVVEFARWVDALIHGEFLERKES